MSGIDANEKLEILILSLRLHIEEQAASEKTTQMLGTLTAINDLCRRQLAATARPPSQVELFDTPGAFFRVQKEDQSLSDAASKVLEGASGNTHHHSPV